MKKIVMLSLSIVLIINAGYSQRDILLESEATNNTIQKKLVQKSNQKWNVLFSETIKPACSNMTGVVSNDTNLYGCSAIKPIIFKIDMNHNIIDSFDITGLPDASKSKVGAYMVGLAYDGTYYYMTHGTDTIYKIDLASKSVVGTIVLPTNTNPLGIAYAPDADGGNGGFWVSLYSKYQVQLFSLTGSLLSTITATDMNNNGEGVLWGLTYDTISPNGPFLFALERNTQRIIQIDVSAKKLYSPVYEINDDMPAWKNAYPYGIYIYQDYEGKDVLGVVYMKLYHIGYDLSTIRMPDVGLSIEGSNMKYYNKINVPITIGCNVYRSGLATVTSFDYHYSVGGKTYTQSITNESITDIYPSKYISHDSIYTPDKVQKDTFKIWFTNINGNPGINSDTLIVSLDIYDRYVQRIVMHELFSSSTCGPCKYGNENMKTIFDENEGKYACVKYQMDWPGTGDPYYTLEGKVRRNYYGVNSVPYLAVDGIYYNGNPSTYTSNLLNSEYEEPAFIDFHKVYKKIGEQKIYVKITVIPLRNISGNNKLFVALVEKETYKNAKTNGETEFHYVFKKFLTNSAGKMVTLLEDQHKVFDYTYEFNGLYRLPADGTEANIIDPTVENSVEDFDNLLAVFWVQNYTTGEVLQSGTVDELTSSINDRTENENQVNIYPNPANDVVNVVSNKEFTQLKVLNLLGQVIFNKEVKTKEYTINTSHFNPGLYIVQLQTPDGIINRKISIK
ncbi:MAG: hypothetical protein BWY27_00375 [Bacteroidetes bacterium ADurb.Bin234]|nr:MAG: hypothetical protein BWY27_00375 [Bacteroidetes bacterium ADurb.Bin234]